jgi:hypothetical protein
MQSKKYNATKTIRTLKSNFFNKTDILVKI